MDIPAPLKEAVETGAAVLMLGSGASLAARDAKGNSLIPEAVTQLV